MGPVANRQPIDHNMVVANNIRAELSRERWSNRQAAVALNVTPNWVNRRMNGETRLDADDIVLFANFLRVPVARLFEDTKKGPSSEENGPRKLPEMDSNHQPAVTSLAAYRRTKQHPTSERDDLATVTPIREAI
jgi:transcriptional regulator with XRE-family HTH domain